MDGGIRRDLRNARKRETCRLPGGLGDTESVGGSLRVGTTVGESERVGVDSIGGGE